MNEAELTKTIKEREAKCKSYEDHNEFPFWAATNFGARGYTIAASATAPDDEYFDLDRLPADCPFPGGLGVQATIDAIWAPVAKKIPNFVAALEEHTKQLIVYRRSGGDADNANKRGWFIGYFLDRGPKSDSGRYGDIWGREPFANPRLSKKARRAGWTLPKSLREFYNIHNGMGMATARTNGVESLLSAKNLEPHPRHPDLLEVFCDSGGNLRLFPRGEDRLVDWDRQTHDQANIGGLWWLFEQDLIHYVTGRRD